MRPQRILPFLVLGLILAAPVHAQSIPDATSESALSAQEDAPDEGIHVSGEWTLTISSPTGEKIKKVTFRNSFVNPEQLASLLTGVHTTGLWGIIVEGGVCEITRDGIVSSSPCVLGPPETEPADPQPAAFYNLTTEIDENFNIILNGTVQPQLDGQIYGVATKLGYCDSFVAPDECNLVSSIATPSSAFTSKQLGTPLDVQSGQVITVEVVIGFN